MKLKNLIKSTISVILVCAMVTTIFSASVPTDSVGGKLSYNDISENDWFYENVKFVTEQGIMNGVAEKRFSPLGKLSRAMSVTILYRMAGEPEISDSHSFTDVESGEWYSDAVAWAYTERITTGKTKTSFAPHDDVSRAEFATFLYRYAEINKLGFPETRDGNVADKKKIPYYAESAVTAMYHSEIINGRSGNVFDPHSPITRCEAAAIINRFSTITMTYTVIGFIGNSITSMGNVPVHFRVLAADMPIKVMNYSVYGSTLSYHCDLFYQDEDEREDAQRCDIYILQDGAGTLPEIGYNQKILDLIESDPDYQGDLQYYFYSGYNIVDEIKDILGKDKAYYAFTASDYVAKFDEMDTEILLGIKKVYAEDYDLPLTYVPEISEFNSDLGLSKYDTFFDGLHPTTLMGYCIALTLFCDIYDVSPMEQNNGNLNPNDIPGETEAEKAAFMAELKKTIADILTVQDISE